MVNGEYISEIYRWYTEETLVVNRRYQRKLVWTLSEKQQFIDTILNNYPVPIFLLVSSENGDKEIIDGLQRLEAIISFILNKYPVKVNGEYQYFNLDVYPGNGILIKNKVLKQKSPIMDAELSRHFMLYQLPVSTINADETVVDDVFKRINSTGRKLSSQDLRQAGVTSTFSELVRVISMGLRGDATEDIIKLNEIADYSLSSVGLDYGLDISEVFWIEQGIIAEEALRRSKDEEIIAILCSCILSDYKSGMSLDALRRLYTSGSTVYRTNEELLTPSRFKDIVTLFQVIIADLEKVFVEKNSTFSQLLFRNDKNYNKDYVFIVVFLAFAQLYSENYHSEDYHAIGDALAGIADRELTEIIRYSECEWNKEVRNHLIARVKAVLIGHMVFKENNPQWNEQCLQQIKQLCVENQMCDFKIGLRDLRDGHINENLIPKCIKTLIAMANTTPYAEGVLVIGVSDKESDAKDFERHYGVSVPKLNEYYVPGIRDEAIKYYGSVQKYMDSIKHIIELEAKNVHSSVIHYILTTMDTLKYGDRILIVLKLSTDKPLFYKNELYVRYNSHNKLIGIGSDEYYTVLNGFKKNESLGALNACRSF